jgi:SPP1 gp7 family putative phage head morphogenesis protein
MNEAASDYIFEAIAQRREFTRHAKALAVLLDDLEVEINQIILRANLGRAGAVNAIIQLIDEAFDQYVENLSVAMIERLETVALNHAVFAAQAMAVAPELPGLRDRLLSNPFGGELLEEALNKHGVSLKDRVRKVIRDGVGKGQAQEEIVKRLKIEANVRDVGDKQLMTIVRTAANHAVSVSDDILADEAGVEEFMFSAVLDHRTTDTCSSLDGKKFRYDDQSAPNPPLHYGCRSTRIPITENVKPTKKTYSEWFSELSEEQQLKILGKRRFDKYKAGEKELGRVYQDV